MDAFLINGPSTLSGSVAVSGAKNAILPIMTACLLARGKSTLTNVPKINDFKTMSHLLRIIGARVEHFDDIMTIDTTDACYWEAPYELVNKMRASIYVLGPLLARFRKAVVAFPGGDAIGIRPVDLHLKAFERLGATIKMEYGNIYAECPNGLKGAEIEFPFITVGATVNCLMAAVLAEGETFIKNTALEPEIDSLIEFLRLMGAKIEKVGKNDLRVIGVNELYPTQMRMMPDRIEAGTLMLASAITRQSFTITNCEPAHLTALIEKMQLAGCDFKIMNYELGIMKERNDGQGNAITILPGKIINPVDIVTEPYPCFPTDLQAQFLAYMCLADGESHIKDTIFPDRFMHTAELNRLGTNITVKAGEATIKGVKQLTGASVMATDIRASAALVLAGLVAKGTTKISRIYHIDRGYERIENKLNSLGANIKRISE